MFRDKVKAQDELIKQSDFNSQLIEGKDRFSKETHRRFEW